MEHGLLEIEWQYDAPGGLREVEGWLLGKPERSGLTIVDGGAKDLEDTYYDTADRLLRQAGCALRVRRETRGGSEATIKSLTPAARNRHERHELTEQIRKEGVEEIYDVPGPVGARLRSLLTGSPSLCPLFRIRTRRKIFGLLLGGADGEAVRVGEVVLDDSEIPLEDGVVRLARVEVEVAASIMPAVVPVLEGFAREMEGALGLLPVAVSKYEAGLRVAGDQREG